jgi:hypothetical protein
VYTPNDGHQPVEDSWVAGGNNVTVVLPYGWIGNIYAYAAGEANIPGMLAEFAFNAWNDYTYFDVSAIVNADDKNGVKMMYPASSLSPRSGCETFPCNNCYYLPDDPQTKVTQETSFLVTLGGSGGSHTHILQTLNIPVEKRDDNVRRTHPRDMITGKKSRRS